MCRAEYQKCPVCDGTGLVSRPPYVAGDQPVWVGVSLGPWPCKTCVGRGVILGPPQQKESLQGPSQHSLSIPPKRKIEVEVWRHMCGAVFTAESIGDEYGRLFTNDGLLKPGWTKGTATFWVEDSDD